jgi:hypothetical protein
MSPAQRFLLDIEELPEGVAPSIALQAAGRGAGSDWWNPETVRI